MDKIKGTVKFKTNFFQAPNNIFDISIITYKGVNKEKVERHINGNEISVYLYLCRLANNKETAFPSYNTIARNCGMSRMTAIKCIDTLFKNNLITKKTRMNPYSDELKNYSNVYEVNMP